MYAHTCQLCDELVTCPWYFPFLQPPMTPCNVCQRVYEGELLSREAAARHRNKPSCSFYYCYYFSCVNNDGEGQWPERWFQIFWLTIIRCLLAPLHLLMRQVGGECKRLCLCIEMKLSDFVCSLQTRLPSSVRWQRARVSRPELSQRWSIPAALTSICVRVSKHLARGRGWRHICCCVCGWNMVAILVHVVTIHAERLWIIGFQSCLFPCVRV